MAYLSEEIKWEPSIYCIQEEDPTLGGETGIFNLPNKQLANRTQHLLSFFSNCHNADGTHSLTESSLATNAKVPESCFDFTNTTSAVHTELEAHQATFNSLKNEIAQMSLVEGTSSQDLYDAITLSWKYGDAGFDVCLFTEDFSFSSGIVSVDVVTPGTVAGDDSIDVNYPEKLTEGATYVLVSDSLTSPLTVVVKSKLNSHRILLEDPVSTTCATAKITNCTWTIADNTVTATNGTMFITKTLDALKAYASGVFEICHNNSNATFTVEYKLSSALNTYDDTETWHTANYLGLAEKGSSFVSSYGIPGGIMQIRITYTAATSAIIHNLVIYTTEDGLYNNFVRTPILKDNLVISRFGALYKDTFAKLEILIGTGSTLLSYDSDGHLVQTTGTTLLTFTDITETDDPPFFSMYTRVTQKPYTLTVGTKYYWQARYTSTRGYSSKWSDISSFTAA